MRLACQQLHISRYDRDSKTWLQEQEASMMSHLTSIIRSLHMEHILSVLILHACMSTSLGLVPHIQSHQSHADRRFLIC